MTSLNRLNGYPIGFYDNSQSPFVWTEVFLREVNRWPDQVLVHLWPLEATVILGMLDRQVPYLSDGLALIRSRGYQPVVRNLGGLAVVADDGVLNFSLFLPNPADQKLDITSAYQLMAAMVQEMLADQGVTVEAYEIVDSYCPGNYDLSIAGKKFAGLAQRRIKDGIVVSIYLSVSGDQEARGQLLADFYQVGIKGEQTLSTYPVVNPSAMANLSDLCPDDLTVADIKDRLLAVLRRYGQSVFDYVPTPSNYEDFDAFETIDQQKQVGQGELR